MIAETIFYRMRIIVPETKERITIVSRVSRLTLALSILPIRTCENEKFG